MADIVERLRRSSTINEDIYALREEAAVEITRLRADLATMNDNHRAMAKLLGDTGTKLERAKDALQFVIDGYERLDVTHQDYRVRVYMVALDAMEFVKADEPPLSPANAGGEK
ncbi:hypothetical protein [Bradyrhizobium sp. Leo121]|uniref:hypothetical protein n=1 Tax=Bradyrhizobium sp. Leo121 TaxID=1571195 RepID=UPI00102883E7|nr:hypothetical protein [Bradyrhizobium sp. Leo121]RZN19507.1 hypothetical protein CWO90_35340 [Bradyrhizobium sp. Leo121]